MNCKGVNVLSAGIEIVSLYIICSFPNWIFGSVFTNSTSNKPFGDPFSGSNNCTLRLSFGINCIEGSEDTITEDEGFGTDTRAELADIVGATKVIN